MEPKLERALIRTFKKYRETPNIKPAELAGIFVNFCYSEFEIHAGLDTRHINIITD